MKRLCMSTILCLAVCLTVSGALAGPIPPDAMMLEVPETGGVLYASGPLALPDGDLLIGGQVQYPGEVRVPHWANYEDPQFIVRNDAIIMRMKPDGTVRWSIRVGDPQADNFMGPTGVLWDGRFLITFQAEDSTFGDQRFIVSEDGHIEETIPFWKIADHYAPRSNTYLPGTGFLGGDSTVVDDDYDRYSGRMEDPTAWLNRDMTLLDLDLNVVWQINLSPLGPRPGNYNAQEVAGGILLLGDEALAERESPQVQYEYRWCTSVVLLDKQTGEILWQLTDAHREGRSGANSAVETPDGALLFTGAYLESGQTLGEDEDLATLTKLTMDGEPLWTKRYEDLDVGSLMNIVPFAEGYAMIGTRLNALDSFIVLYVDEDGEVLGTLALDPDDKQMPGWVMLTEGLSGTVYLSGPVRTLYDRETGTGGELVGSFLSVLEEAHFDAPSLAARP